MPTDQIIQRIYMKGTLDVVSPLIIGSGHDESSDIDIMRDWDGVPFIPGTSLAGVFQHHLINTFPGQKELIDNIFGVANRAERKFIQSMIYFYDAMPLQKKDHAVSVRDGVRLNYTTRTADDKAKYNYETINSGNQFQFRLGAVIRECHQNMVDTIKDILYQIYSALQQGEISFGAKTRRGFGKVKLTNAACMLLDFYNNPNNIQNWIDFDWTKVTDTSAINTLKTSVLKKQMKRTFKGEYTFAIPYSILIRDYQVTNDVDSQHLTNAQKNPIIPGTSWNGAIRHGMHQILLELGLSTQQADSFITSLFGDVDEDTKFAKASRIRFEESVIEDSKSIPYTRNRIDRFTGGTVDSALFTEMPSYKGTVTLRLSIQKPRHRDLAALYLTLCDLANGILPIGGAVSVGRGILESRMIEIDDKDTYLEKLAKLIRRLKNADREN